MRIITWNCQGAFRKKIGMVIDLRPDILVIQECEHPDKWNLIDSMPLPKYKHWYSDGGSKGICILSFSEFDIELLPDFNSEFRYVLPLRISDAIQSFTMFAVWAMPNEENRNARYIGQVWNTIHYYESLLNSSIIILGDFNSNTIWDLKRRIENHSNVVSYLMEKGITSLYHTLQNEEQGRESQPTFYLQRNPQKPYHIDYVFASDELAKTVFSFEIGEREKWLEYSDHMPIICDFNL